ncbi:MAG: CDP-glycerol glycerophosphotransferase family protein [Lachnospiraceae bacterium]|nr:CDP-glycerol glycerophosphotransferase family protein [Lachnospiraceae bacterium]
MTVTEIRWEHIYLHVKIQDDHPEDYDYRIDDLLGHAYPVEYAQGELCINFMNIPSVEVLPRGKWYLLAENRSGSGVTPLPIVPDCGYQLENLDKVYRYGAGTWAYVVTMRVCDGTAFDRTEVWKRQRKIPENGQKKTPAHNEDLKGPGGNAQDSLYFYIQTDYFRQKNSDGRHHPVREARTIQEVLKGLAADAARALLNGIYQILAAGSHRDGKHILLMSEMRVMNGGNLAALDERLRERGLDQEYHISYSFSKTLEGTVLGSMKNWLRLIRLTARQDFIFVDDYVPIFQTIQLRKETKLIQLWHAGVGFKAVGYARFGRDGSPHPRGTCHRRYDYVVVGAKGLVPVYEEVFGVSREKILPLGLPRMDQYLNGERSEVFRREFYQSHPKLRSRKLILFAPTYRGTGQRDAYYPWDKIDFNAVYEMCGETYVFALKMHPFVRDLPEIPESMQDRVLTFSAEDNINDLFYVTEILITDFSSNIYEFSLQNKPMIFYAFDKDYYQLIRGVHRRLEEFAPGKICETFDEVVRAIGAEDFEQEKRERFIRDSFEVEEGRAGDRIIDQIILGHS